VSDQKAFAKFPTVDGGYQYVDIFAIEAIGQSAAPEIAVIFTVGSERFYQVEIGIQELDRSKEPDAASWCLSLVSKVARAGMPYVPDSDDEDGFTPPKGPAKVHGERV
jgi:hypothetical protein